MSEAVSYLLDTHALIWLAIDDLRVSRTARERVMEPSSRLLLSVASVWEMAIKHSLGRLEMALPLAEFVQSQQKALAFDILDIRLGHALMVENMPFHHRDPFDRLLAGQALSEGVPVLSADEHFDAYGVSRIW